MIALLLLAACFGDPEPTPVTLPIAAEKATFATVASLGSFRLQAAVKRTTTSSTGPPKVSEETLELRWRDTDHWSFRLARDGRVRSETVVFGGVAWSSSSGGPLRQRRDAEPYRVQLATVWDPWQWGLESFARSVVYDEGVVELDDGRRVRRHLLSLAPQAPTDAQTTAAEPTATDAPVASPAKARTKPRSGWTPTAVSGELWIDEATAVRLSGTVTVEAASSTAGLRVELLFSVDDIGLDPGISAPVGDKP